MLNDNVTSLSPAFERNNVPVVLAVNNLFAPYAGVFIQSLLDHASEEHNYDIIIFQRDISDENKRLLNSLVKGYTNVSVRFYDPSPCLASFNFKFDDDANHWPIEVFYKIIAPHILNYSGRIISTDVDTLLKTDIARLMDEDLEGYSVGGVCSVPLIGMYERDYTQFRNNIRIRDYVHNVLGFGVDDIKNYVCAGLLLFDCDKYVQELEIETILNTAHRSGYFYPEQDVLNVLMKGRIKVINFAWNVHTISTPIQIENFNAASKVIGKACERAYEDPYILHFAGRPKPWVCPDVPWGSEWWQTALRTPFVGHIIARMMGELEKRRAYFRDRYGKEVDVWDPASKGIE